MGASDEAQLAFAIQSGRSIYTFNVGDFARIHQQYIAQQMNHTGIIVIPEQRYSIGVKIRRLAALVNSISAEEMVNRMEFL